MCAGEVRRAQEKGSARILEGIVEGNLTARSIATLLLRRLLLLRLVFVRCLVSVRLLVFVRRLVEGRRKPCMCSAHQVAFHNATAHT